MNDQEFGLIITWLRGFHETDTKGLPKQRYLPKEQDAKARLLLARALRTRSFHRQQLLNDLADLIDPAPEGLHSVPRTLVFRFRKRGIRLDTIRRSEIYFYIGDLVNAGTKVEAAIEFAMAQFKLKRSVVFEIWSSLKWERDIVWPKPSDG